MLEVWGSQRSPDRGGPHRAALSLGSSTEMNEEQIETFKIEVDLRWCCIVGSFLCVAEWETGIPGVCCACVLIRLLIFLLLTKVTLIRQIPLVKSSLSLIPPFTLCSLFFLSPHLLIDSFEAGWGFHGNCFHSPSASKARLLLNAHPAFFFFPSVALLFDISLSAVCLLLHTFCKWRLQVRKVHCLFEMGFGPTSNRGVPQTHKIRFNVDNDTYDPWLFQKCVTYPVCHHSSWLHARRRSVERWWRGGECVWAGGEGGWDGVEWQGGTQMWMRRVVSVTRCSSADAAYRRDGGKVWNLLPNWPSPHKDHHQTPAVLYPCQFSNGVG